MTAAIATRTSFRRRAARVLPQYFTPEYHPMWPLAMLTLVMIGVFLATFTGLFVAVGGTLAVKFVSVPIAFFTIVILWLMPDVKRGTEPPFAKLLAIFVALRLLWPAYLALVLPGLPWITPPRMVLMVMILMMLVHLPQNGESRERIAGIFTHDKFVMRSFMTFLFIAFAIIPFTADPIETLDFTVQRLVLNLAPMLMATLLFVQASRIGATIRQMNVVLILTMLISIVENFMQMPPWTNIIPSFLKIDPILMETILSPQARIGDGRYRIRSTFPIVGYYSQYVGLILPMLTLAMLKMRGRSVILALLLVPLILQTVWFVNSRTAFVALFITLFGFGGMMTMRSIIYPKARDTLKVAITISIILAMLGGLAAAIAGSHRLQVYTFGGVQHTASNDTRDVQWANTWRHLRTNPIGVGLGNSPTFVGTTNNKVPFPIVDSLWINQLVDVGVLGFLAFYACLIRLVWIGVVTFLRAGTPEEELAGGLALAITIFIATSYVISHYDNLFIVFMFGSALLSLNRSQEARLGIVRRAPPVGSLLPVPRPA